MVVGTGNSGQWVPPTHTSWENHSCLLLISGAWGPGPLAICHIHRDSACHTCRPALSLRAMEGPLNRPYPSAQSSGQPFQQALEPCSPWHTPKPPRVLLASLSLSSDINEICLHTPRAGVPPLLRPASQHSSFPAAPAMAIADGPQMEHLLQAKAWSLDSAR